MQAASNRTRPAAGFTLIEAVIAIVILSVALPAMLMALRDAQARRAEPVMSERARWLAAEALEDVIADRHSPSRGYGHIIEANYPAENPVAGFPGFSRTVQVAETDATLSTPGAGYKTVSVTVTYPRAGGGSHALMLETVLTEYTP